jgi:hypothetical protein
MKIYETFGVMNGDLFRSDLIGYAFEIETADILPNAYRGKNALLLGLAKSSGKRVSYLYELIGEKMQKEFLSDLGIISKRGITERGIERLLGKEIIGFVDPHKHSLQGIGIMEE